MLRRATTTTAMLSFVLAAVFSVLPLAVLASASSSLPESLHQHGNPVDAATAVSPTSKSFLATANNPAAAAIRNQRYQRQLTNKQHDLWHGRRYTGGHDVNDSNRANIMNERTAPSGRRDLQPRIIGGRDAKAGEFAYYAHGIDEELCGGSLIAPNIVLSAAHCVKAFTGKTLTIGSNDLLSDDKNAEILDIDFLYPHPDYTPGPEDNDIMLIKLKESAQRSPVVTLNTDMDEPVTDQAVVVIGFGIMDWDVGAVSETLQEVEVQTLTWRDCEQILPDIQEFHVCAGLPEGGKDSCAGDSGGPLVDASNTNLQYGIISYGYGCAEPNSPGVYTSVAYYNEWISEFVCSESDDPPEQFNCRGRQAGTGDNDDDATNFPTTSPSTLAPTPSPTVTSTPSPTTLAPVTPMPSLEPTLVASDTPTSVPSLRPSVSRQPSEMPSDVPSDVPSDMPSDSPTSVPSQTLVPAEQKELETQQEEAELVQERNSENTAVPFTSSSSTTTSGAMSVYKTTMMLVTFFLGVAGMATML